MDINFRNCTEFEVELYHNLKSQLINYSFHKKILEGQLKIQPEIPDYKRTLSSLTRVNQYIPLLEQQLVSLIEEVNAR